MEESVSDEILTYGLMLVTGAPVVVTRALDGGEFGGGVTLCLALVAVALVGLAHLALRHRSLPVARARHARDEVAAGTAAVRIRRRAK